MNIITKAENVELTDELRGQIEEKIVVGLDKYLGNFKEGVAVANLRIKKRSRWGYRVNFSMWLPGKKHIFAQVRHSDLSLALVQLKKEAARQIKDYLGRVSLKRRRVAF